VAERLPEARWFELENHGFVVVELDAERADAHWFCVDTEDPAATALHAASWRHRLDHPGRLDRLDDPGDPLAPRAGTGPDPGPHVVVPARPADAVDGSGRRLPTFLRRIRSSYDRIRRKLG